MKNSPGDNGGQARSAVALGASCEPHRLAALDNLEILDTPSEECYDAITRLVARTMHVPVALISLVDDCRQWFKSRVGLGVAETARDISFCTHAVLGQAPLVVRDARFDARFAGNPLVTGAPMIRAYLGVPLKTLSGHAVGTICAIDMSPRDFCEADVATMVDFGRLVEAMLHAREARLASVRSAQLAARTEHLFQDTFNLSAVGILHTSLGGQLLRINRRACEILGYSDRELQWTSFVDITHPDDVLKNAELFHRMVAGELDSYCMEKRFLRKDGEYVWARLSVVLARTESLEPSYMIAVIDDISQRKHVEGQLLDARDSLQEEVRVRTLRLEENNAALGAQIKRVLESTGAARQAEARLQAITDKVPAMVGYWNRDLRCEFSNAAYREWYGLEPGTIIGMRMADLLGEQLFALNKPYILAALAGREQRFERAIAKADGSMGHVDAYYTPDTDELGDVRGFCVLVTDITQRKIAELKLQEASQTDKLTGLANRSLFMERLQGALSRVNAGRQRCIAVLFLDFDRFKLVNDTLGHDAGDELLRQIAQRLRGQLRASDSGAAEPMGNLVSRFGGDEFLVLLNDLREPEDALKIAERILNALAPAFEVVGTDVYSTASIGVFAPDRCDATAEEVIRNADVAMYEAKRSGPGCVVRFDESMHARLARVVTIEASLRKALGSEQLHLAYQPIVDLSTGEMVSAEALLRWTHPEMGEISPAEFIPVAEESGLIVALGEWVVREACQMLSRWQQPGPCGGPMVVSVNISRVELALGEKLVSKVQRILAATGVPAGRLQIEVTEREIARPGSKVLDTMRSLKGLGVRLAMDDFGTGVSSLGELRTHPFDAVKIDQSMVRGIERGGDELAVIHAAVQLVENLGMASVAEGVDDPAQTPFLQSIGCRYAQGYLFGRPMREAQLLQWQAARGVRLADVATCSQ
jgi:diguanylate cyclase (GGDEF)-like protein/PAS domain S-box-containing protein